jgi:energy-converting hydrogenase Eha subunit E
MGRTVGAGEIVLGVIASWFGHVVTSPVVGVCEVEVGSMGGAWRQFGHQQPAAIAAGVTPRAHHTPATIVTERQV